MQRFLRVLCVVRLHDWKTEADADGPVTFCTRCGHVKHSRTGETLEPRPPGVGRGVGGGL
jgi:hypothetical protein